jgi:hypothetical protein
VGVDRGEEPAHRLGAVVLERQRRHPHPRVVGHQRDERVDVALGEGGDEPVGQRPLLRTTGRRRPVGRSRGVHPHPGPLEGAGDGLLGQLQERGGLARPVPEHVAQQQHRALVGR